MKKWQEQLVNDVEAETERMQTTEGANPRGFLIKDRFVSVWTSLIYNQRTGNFYAYGPAESVFAPGDVHWYEDYTIWLKPKGD